MTTSERWTQIEELFHRVSECAPDARARLLAEVGDPQLRREVEALLASANSATDDWDPGKVKGPTAMGSAGANLLERCEVARF